MLERAFTGFIALENMSSEKWQDILQVGNTYTPEECERHYKILAKDAHPDRGGSHDAMQKLNWARDQERQELSK